MKKIAVFGVGRMGQAISYAMSQLGYYVIGLDTNKGAIEEFKNHTGDNGKFYDCNEVNYKELLSEFECPEVVISSLPYHQTEEVGRFCVDSGIRYCDLGGRVDVSKSINDYAVQEASKPVMTDLGLAPGWVNILAEEGYRNLYGGGSLITVEMMVGGLPGYLESSDNPMRYKVTWSVDGLINEYRDDCIILEDSEVKTVKGMDGLIVVESEHLGKLEAFYTSGGASHTIDSMKNRGVHNCSYRTLRYKGHRDIVRFLINDCGLDDKTLEQIFIDGCGVANEDEVVIMARVSKDNKTWDEEKLIKSDENFSAMQKATAFPISSVAALLADGVFDGKKIERRGYDIHYRKSLSYSDIPFDKFSLNLSRLGL